MGRHPTNESLISFNSQEEKAAFITQSVTSMKKFLMNTRPETDQELEERLHEYFSICAEAGIPPVYEKMCLFIGSYGKQFSEWADGNKLGTGPRCQELCIKARAICSAFEAEAAMNNKLNPVVYIFRGKALYELKDNPEIAFSIASDERPKEEILAEAKALEEI